MSRLPAHFLRRDSGSVLVGVLWCVVLLTVVVIGALHSTQMDLLAGKNHTDRIKAHYLALAGTERAKALLYHDMLDRIQTGKNHTGALYDDSQRLRDVSLGAGKFRILRRAHSEEHSGIISGIEDEESRLNVNNATADELQKLQDMTPAMANSIVLWRTADKTTLQGGSAGDDEYYASLQPPVRPRGGPFETVRELLLVRGITRPLLMGHDYKQNGSIDSGEEADDDNDSSVSGWAAILTVNSSTKNQSAAATDRVNVQTADEAALTAVDGITSDIAKAIVSSRGRNKINTIADLLDVSAAPAGNQGARQPQQNQQNGPKVISQDLLQRIADSVTAASDTDQQGLININTASPEVLRCLAQITPDLARAIVTYRKSEGYFANIAELLRVQGMTTDIFKALAPRITARSETFRIISEGKITSSGATQRIQIIVHIARHEVKILSYREDL